MNILKENILKLESNLAKFPERVARFKELFPMVLQKEVPLSATGISPRVFFHWKKSGIVENDVKDAANRTWVRVNLFDFIWLRICDILRDFGLPLSEIGKAKNQLFTDQLADMTANRAQVFELLSRMKISEEEKESFKECLDAILGLAHLLPPEEKIYTTTFGMMVLGALIERSPISLYVVRENKKNDFLILPDDIFDKAPETRSLFQLPFLRIPLNNIIHDFLDEKKNEKYLPLIGLFSFKETQLLDAIRKGDFKEIIVKPADGGEEFIIEKVRRMDLFEEDVKKVKRIIGLKSYKEITLKQRNNKHLYVEVTTRI